MGKGAVRADGTPYEGSPKMHGNPLSKTEASIDKTIQVLGGDPANPFLLFPDVQEAMAGVLAEKSKVAADLKSKQDAWAKANPELSKKWDLFHSGELPQLDFAGIEQKPQNVVQRAPDRRVVADVKSPPGAEADDRHRFPGRRARMRPSECCWHCIGPL